MIVQHLAANRQGRDFVVGDIHAAVTPLRDRLDALGFEPARDRLLCVGDLVDRGPEHERVVDLLEEPWFYAVLGNHDVSLLHAMGNEPPSPNGLPYRCERHDWFWRLEEAQRQRLLQGLEALPYAIEVETPEGLVGIVHAEVPPEYPDWATFLAALEDPLTGERARYQAIWSRELGERCRDPRLEAGVESLGRVGALPGVLRVFHGHTLMSGLTMRRLGNRYWIETGGWLGGYWGGGFEGEPQFTILDIRAPQ